MPDPTPDSPPSQVTTALADRAIASGEDNGGNINTGLISNIRGGAIEIEDQGATLSAAVGDAMGQRQAAAGALRCGAMQRNYRD